MTLPHKHRRNRLLTVSSFIAVKLAQRCVFSDVADSSQSDIDDYDPTTGLRVCIYYV